MLATEGYAMFKMAQDLSQTVRQLLTGVPGPLSGFESYMWNRWRLATVRLEQQHKRGIG